MIFQSTKKKLKKTRKMFAFFFLSSLEVVFLFQYWPEKYIFISMFIHWLLMESEWISKDINSLEQDRSDFYHDNGLDVAMRWNEFLSIVKPTIGMPEMIFSFFCVWLVEMMFVLAFRLLSSALEGFRCHQKSVFWREKNFGLEIFKYSKKE